MRREMDADADRAAIEAWKDFAWAALMGTLTVITAHFWGVEAALAGFSFTIWLRFYQHETKEGKK